jgi:hypothetical protein
MRTPMSKTSAETHKLFESLTHFVRMWPEGTVGAILAVQWTLSKRTSPSQKGYKLGPTSDIIAL